MTKRDELAPPSDDLIRFAITEEYGERCLTFDPDCYTCQAWLQYDRLSAQQREPGVAAPKFSAIMHQIALWSDDEGLDLSTGQGDALTRRVISLFKSSDGGEPEAERTQRRLAVSDEGLGAMQVVPREPLSGPSEALADVSVDELATALDRLVNAKALKGVRELVAGWNGENRPEGRYKNRHPSRLGARIETNCGRIYELDELMQSGRAVLDRLAKSGRRG